MRARTKSVSSMNEYFEEETEAETRPSDVRLSDVRLSDVRLSGTSSTRSSSIWSSGDDWDDDAASSASSTMRVRRCSHSKRISFDDDVKVETIPSLSSIDEKTKKDLWYSADDFRRMQQQE
ncbi:hypothetical protein Ae201684P_003191 [Aphanomyces euteiches]|uniref:Uncharacterized protein n=1 Tax=Aphanomyces euteiches TaxID=100861 RepID=A0A6G0WAN9_9STRA|nr:hypothetical protein Ae201684_016985 [Aphanomyces euteiches]KAH9073688.1 hypothetical protein Ae201684P_003191 [Aphanomyces euteiches]KAH9158037.1 hypothetical protein AeRB84_000172 [Aphanomyces euteiches]